jgi:hypothetical protein
MAKISDRKMPGWVSSPESIDRLAQGVHSPHSHFFSTQERRWGLMAASLCGLVGILISLNHQSYSPLQSVKLVPKVMLISGLSSASQVPMGQFQIQDQTLVKILRIPGAKVAEDVASKVQAGSDLLSPRHPLK